MKILEVCPFSAGVCGVWTRAREEALRLKKRGHNMTIFSSNFTKGNNEIASDDDEVEGIKIKRFRSFQPGKGRLKFLPGGESYMFWNFVKEAVKMSPDVIICHNYRQFHTDLSLRVAKKLRSQGKKCKVFLVTHAPFPEGDITRTFWGHAAAWFYDIFIGRFTLKKFDKILSISNWEIPFLEKIGAMKEKIVYIPNGIPDEFFSSKSGKEEKKILFLGRISPKKKIETLVSAISFIDDKKVKIEIVGPKEEEYSSKIDRAVRILKVGDRVKFLKPVYDLTEKIKKIDSAKIFVLPSRVEGMPQSLIEAMARGKVVIGSDSLAIRDLIKDGENGYLFEFDNPEDLANKINFALGKGGERIGDNARKSVAKFKWSEVIKQIESLIR